MARRKMKVAKPRSASSAVQKKAQEVVLRLVDASGSQSELARRIGVTSNQVNHIVSKNRAPGHKLLVGIARLDEVSALAALGQADLWDLLQTPAVVTVLEQLRSEPACSDRADWAVRSILSFEPDMASDPDQLAGNARLLISVLSAQQTSRRKPTRAQH